MREPESGVQSPPGDPGFEPEAAEAALAAVGLTDCPRQPARSCPAMRRRVAILRALLAEYDLLFLDEPFKAWIRDQGDRYGGIPAAGAPEGWCCSSPTRRAGGLGAVQRLELSWNPRRRVGTTKAEKQKNWMPEGHPLFS